MADTKISALTAATAYNAGDVVPIVQSGVTKKIDLTTVPLSTVIKVIYIATLGTSTYTPSTGVRALFVECFGPGGGGGGAVSAASAACAGAGGGAGGYSAKYLSGTLKSSYSVTIGTGGTGGANTGTNGTAGTSATTFDSPSVCTAGAGAGGNGSTATTTAPAFVTTNTAGGTSTVGDRGGLGSDGTPGIRLSATQALGGTGGSSRMSGSVQGGLNGGGGQNGVNGSGGGGASSISATGFGGGNGGQGFIRVVEFF